MNIHEQVKKIIGSEHLSHNDYARIIVDQNDTIRKQNEVIGILRVMLSNYDTFIERIHDQSHVVNILNNIAKGEYDDESKIQSGEDVRYRNRIAEDYPEPTD